MQFYYGYKQDSGDDPFGSVDDSQTVWLIIYYYYLLYIFFTLIYSYFTFEMHTSIYKVSNYQRKITTRARHSDSPRIDVVECEIFCLETGRKSTMKSLRRLFYAWDVGCRTSVYAQKSFGISNQKLLV